MEVTKLDERLVKNGSLVLTKYMLETVEKGHELKSIIENKDNENPTKGNGLSPKANAAYWSLWNFFGTYKVVKETLEDKFKDKNQQALNLYSCFAASNSSLHYLKKFNPVKKRAGGINPPNFESTEREILETIVKNHMSLMKNSKTSDDLLSTAYLHFEQLIESAKDEARAVKYSSFRNQLVNFPIEVSDGCVVMGFSIQEKAYIEESPDLKWEFIVGNEEAVELLQYCLRTAFLYDPSQKQNPAKDEIPRLIILYGPFGTGKSLIGEIMISEGVRLSKKTGIPFNPRRIDNSVKSSLYSESSRNLRERFEQACDDTGVGLTFGDEFDYVFPPHTITAQETDLQLVGDYRKLVYGRRDLDRGNNFHVIALNDLSRLNPGIEGRGIKILCEGPKSENDYLRLFKIETRKKQKYFDFTESDYITVAKKLHQLNSKGRPVNILKIRH